jgi:hypothetical protein
LLLASPDVVLVFDGVFLLRPQLNDAWDLRIFLKVDFQETLGCPTFGLQDMNSGSPDSRCYAPARLLAPFPDRPGARRSVPRMSRMLDNLRIHQRFVAVLLPPLVLLAALAAGRIRSNVTEGVRAGRVNTLVILTITLAGLANELQKERDLSAVYIGNPSSGPQNVSR